MCVCVRVCVRGGDERLEYISTVCSRTSLFEMGRCVCLLYGKGSLCHVF